MEISWGDFSLVMEKTVALILALIPVLAVMQLPSFIRFINIVVGRVKARQKKNDIRHLEKEIS